MENYKAIRERCPQCGNDSFYNNFLLQEGHHARVFVECSKCGVLVARYILHGYIDPHYNYGSTLKMIRNASHYGDSIRNLEEELKPHQERAKTQFTEVKEKLKESPPNTEEQHRETIIEIIHKYGILEDG